MVRGINILWSTQRTLCSQSSALKRQRWLSFTPISANDLRGYAQLCGLQIANSSCSLPPCTPDYNMFVINLQQQFVELETLGEQKMIYIRRTPSRKVNWADEGNLCIALNKRARYP